MQAQPMLGLATHSGSWFQMPSPFLSGGWQNTLTSHYVAHLRSRSAEEKNFLPQEKCVIRPILGSVHGAGVAIFGPDEKVGTDTHPISSETIR